MRLKTKPIPTKELIHSGKNPEKDFFYPYFRYAKTHPGIVKAHSTFTRKNRHPELNAFLQAHRNKIKVFADVGGANYADAPGAQDARQALGKEARVLAVDIYRSKKGLSQFGVEEVVHSIQRAPLPIECDAIKFANVSYYMSRPVLVRTLNNIWRSLRPGGFLLGASDRGGSRVGIDEHQFVLMKVRKSKKNPLGFVEIRGVGA